MIGEASLGMNAAFALFWGRTLADPTLAVPYRVAGHHALGEQLLRIADEIPGGPADDGRLIASWGERLGLASWYRLIPFEA